MSNLELTTGEYLLEGYLEPLDLSQNALARAINVPAGRINEIIKGTRKITIDTDLRLCKFFEKSEGFFLRIQEEIERRKLKNSLEKELQHIPTYTERFGKVSHA